MFDKYNEALKYYSVETNICYSFISLNIQQID